MPFFNSDLFLYQQLQTISAFGNHPVVIILIVSIIFIFLFYKGYGREAFFVLFSLTSIIYATLLKGIFKGHRPLTAIPNSIILFDKYSFPSLHVVFYTVFWGFIVYLTFKLKKLDAVLRHVIRFLAFYFIIFVGISRILLGMHWLKDVIAGYLFGVIFLYLFVFLYRHKKDTKKT